MEQFIYRDHDHSYWYGKKRLPSVTQVLAPVVDYSQVPADLLEKAARFGSALHLAVKLFLLDDLVESSLDPGLVPALESFKAWKETMDLDWSEDNVIIEQPMYHRLGYAGTADLVFIKEKLIFDLKTREYNPLADPMQLVAYENLVKVAYPGDYEKWVLKLDPAGGYHVKKAHHREAWRRFRYLLDYQQMTTTIKSWR